MSNLAELVFIPAPAIGHILSTVKVAKLILQRTQRISISVHIINLPLNSSNINAYVDTQSRDNSYRTQLTFITYPPLSTPLTSSPSFFSKVIEAHKPLVKQALEDRVKARLSKPVGFVLDLFCIGMVDVANELQIPSYNFLTSGACVLNLIFHVQSLADDHLVDVVTELSKPEYEIIVPGFKNPVTSDVIPEVFKDRENGCEMFLDFARKLREMKGILVNTYVELEPFAIQTLHNREDKKIPPVYPVGPVLDLDQKSRGGCTNEEKESVIKWLDDQPNCLVVFLCFGSEGRFNEEQVKEIANGLEKSGHCFLWSLPKPLRQEIAGNIGENETFLDGLPVGFIDRTAHLGKVIGWAPQVEVLAHSAVGGFVTHCGWNSILESLWFGVPIATWPMYAEQQLNAFELVRELELAVDIRKDYRSESETKLGNFLVSAEEIVDGVNKLMNMDGKMRENVKKICENGKKGLMEGGSSYYWLGRFVEDVLSNVAQERNR